MNNTELLWNDCTMRNGSPPTLDQACTVLWGPSKIHEAGIFHSDMSHCIMMVMCGSTGTVWIGFSCAHLDEEDDLSQEMAAVR